MKRILVYFVAICLLAMFTIPAYAAPPKQHRFGVSFFDEGSAHSTPKSGRGDVYVVNDIIYFLDDNGVETSMIASAAATAWDDIGDPDGATAIDMTTFATTIDFGGTADMFILEFTGAFGDVSGMLLEQKTGNPTNGTILEIKLADTDPDFISLATSGVEVVNIDADAVVTLSPQSSPTNTIVLSPGAAATTAILITDTDYTNALSVGDNDILLTTGDINATNYDLTGATGDLALVGDVTAVDGTYSGNVSVTGTFLQDALSATTADATITLDGTGTGGVSIGTVAGSGAITLGGSATAVTLPATVDLTLSGGDLTITDTANADTVAVTNNTMTTADLFQLTTGGTRTSGNVIKIIDSATTAPSIGITADSMTTGNVVAIQADALEAGGALLYLDSDGIPDTSTFYIEAAGTGTDYTLAKDGVAVHSGVASTDVITITTGDVQIDDGLLEIDTDEDDTTKIERAQATVTGPVVSIVEQTDTAASAVALLLLDQDTDSVPSSALEIDTEGAYAIKIDALIAAGDGVLVDVADSYTGQWTIIDAGPWLGTTGEGVWQFTSDSGAVNEVGQVIQVNLQGTGTAGTATEGKAFHAESQAAVKAGESLVYLDI
ncbi:MAG: hypothetical protein KAT70_03260, partial [Thermoplasmata archaeon]|nr:hypothetical protein [Thermoplasmata archaeon]